MITGNMLIARGWTEGPVIGDALRAAARLAAEGLDDEAVLDALDRVKADPNTVAEEDPLYDFAAKLRASTARSEARPAIRDTPLDAPVWGERLIDRQAVEQLRNAMRLPVTVGGALMPDAHVGYGIPIGGVVALENAVAPYMVGVDIACRMMMSIYPVGTGAWVRNASKRDKLTKVLREETRFGVGANFGRYERREHAVLDDAAWQETRLLGHLKDKAHAQLGTSGSGNHFVDAGLLEVDDRGAEALGVEPGTFLAVMSHSGSRGVGAKIAAHYSKRAQELTDLPKNLRHLAWLDLDSEDGQAYWLSMNLAGRFASACHHVIHRSIARRLGLKPAKQVENHHNFAWRETWGDRTVYVHRKGATPAHRGVLGIIPGSQGHNSYLVRGLGNEASINSASHGAGRQMSRKVAKNTIPRKERDAWLRTRKVELLDGGMDEAPQAYKDIREVMAEQTDLVEPLAIFKPRLVLMSRDGRS